MKTFFGQVALMIFTAAPTNGPEDKVVFYAAIDTGATQSLCSRQLAEQLFGEWKPTGKKKYFMFDSNKMQSEFVKGTLNLAKNDGTISTFEPMTFIIILLFSQPKDGPMFPRIDMIIGDDIAWKEFLFPGNKDWNMTDVVEHKLGIL